MAALVGWLLWAPQPAQAQRRMRDVFAEMPDSVLELLTTNNRLDCIDFIENGIQARVRNKFDEYAELKAMNDTYLHIQLSVADRVEMKLLSGPDSVQYVCLVHTFAGPVEESTVALYTSDWKRREVAERLPHPDYEALWAMPDTLTEQQAAERRRQVDLRLMKAELDPDEDTLTFTLQTGTLGEDEQKDVQPLTHPVRYRWNAATSRFE